MIAVVMQFRGKWCCTIMGLATIGLASCSVGSSWDTEVPSSKCDAFGANRLSVLHSERIGGTSLHLQRVPFVPVNGRNEHEQGCNSLRVNGLQEDSWPVPAAICA